MKSKKIILISLVSIFLVIFIIFANKTLRDNIFNIQNQFASDDYEISQETLDKTIEFELNLDDMSSQIGKKIDIDDECYLEIESLELQDNGQYDIIFISYGHYNDEESVLYTGNYYKFSDDKNFEIITTSKLYTDENEWYTSSVYRG